MGGVLFIGALTGLGFLVGRSTGATIGFILACLILNA
jgi:hypothetical protein